MEGEVGRLARVWIEMGNPPRVAGLQKADGRAVVCACVDRWMERWTGGKGGNVLRLADGSLRAAPREWRPLRWSHGKPTASRDARHHTVPGPEAAAGQAGQVSTMGRWCAICPSQQAFRPGEAEGQWARPTGSDGHMIAPQQKVRWTRSSVLDARLVCGGQRRWLVVVLVHSKWRGQAGNDE